MRSVGQTLHGAVRVTFSAEAIRRVRIGRRSTQHFMQQLKQDHPDGFIPDAAWYRAFIAKTMLFRAVQDVVKAAKFPAYQANISTYTAALLAHRCGDMLRYDEIWNSQTVSGELKVMLVEWARAVDRALRETAGMKMPTEWAKRAECWEAIRSIEVQVPSLGVSELTP